MEELMEPIIQIKNVTKTFIGKDNQVEALKGISLDINKGDIYGIIGMSGAGKSTLVRCLNYLEKPTTGTVVVEDQDLSTLTEAELRKVRTGIAMIFQHFNLLMQRSVLDNVCFPMEIVGVKKQAARKRAMELLEIVGLKEKADAYPSQLSGGQKQRVAIARALANTPKILLCDEATSALDPTTTKEILKLLQDINRQYGITTGDLFPCSHYRCRRTGRARNGGGGLLQTPVRSRKKAGVHGGSQGKGNVRQTLHPHCFHREFFFRACDRQYGAGVQGSRQHPVSGYQGHRWYRPWTDDLTAAGG